MGWPEWFVVGMWLFDVAHKFVKGVKDDDMSSGQVTLVLFIYAVWIALLAWVLHEGGFW